MVPDHTRKKYYNLCTEQNSPLHENLNKGLNCGLAAGLIIQTVNISDAIRSYLCSSAPVSESDLVTYYKKLQGCTSLGMNVGLLRLEVQKLMRREIEDEEKAVLEAKFEMEVVEEEMTRKQEIEAKGDGGFFFLVIRSFKTTLSFSV